MTKDIDTSFFQIFIDRLDMYIQPQTKEHIVTFILGYEAGKGNRNFTDEISRIMEKEYKIIKPAMGWPYQVEIYSVNNSYSWEQSFKEITKKLVNNHNI